LWRKRALEPRGDETYVLGILFVDKVFPVNYDIKNQIMLKTLKYLLTLIFLISMGATYHLYQENQDLRAEIIQLQQKTEALDSAWAQSANQLVRCKETQWAKEP